jgi:hypothetical protein
MRRLCAIVVALGSLARADEAGPILLAHHALVAPKLFELQRAAAPRGVEIAAPEAPLEPASESVLAEVRPLYRNMAFARAVTKLDAATDLMIRGREPTPAMVRALAEVEVWRGALRLLAHDARGAAEHFVLARSLVPSVTPEPILPPKVRAAFRAAKAGKPVAVTVHLAPAGAHLYLDGRETSGAVTAAPGLHYVVATRADRVLEARLVRIVKGAAQIDLNLREAATPAEALRAARWWAFDDAIAEVVKRPLYGVAFEEEQFVLVAHNRALLKTPSAEQAIAFVCDATRACKPLPPPAAPSPAPTVIVVREAPPTAPPPRPVWKRAWFWGVLGAGLLVVAGVATGAALGANAQTDYVVHVR